MSVTENHVLKIDADGNGPAKVTVRTRKGARETQLAPGSTMYVSTGNVISVHIEGQVKSEIH